MFLTRLEKYYPEWYNPSEELSSLFHENNMLELAKVLGYVHYQLSGDFEILGKKDIHLLRNIRSLPIWKSLDPYDTFISMREAESNEYLFTGGSSNTHNGGIKNKFENWTVTSLFRGCYVLGCIAFSDIEEVHFDSFGSHTTILQSELLILLSLIARQIDPSMGLENTPLEIADSKINGWVERSV
ncbi:hypothetical protein OCU04_002196 [Sclerotinia nivalis]|uniref:Uncharacterized protein n=1 Tax=Sclerotinia nivalis TaxID=352851 RepID=A0A9X0B033_9HELO|nr:hypothetical protein OCU04_002196 [Sclerotinia nivalis]